MTGAGLASAGSAALEEVADMKEKVHEGKGLKYLVLEPDGFDEDRQYPMVMLLHGYGASIGDLAAVCPVIDLEGYVYVCPRAPVRIEVGPGMAGYAWVHFGDEDESVDDQRAEELLGGLFEEVKELYEIGPGQVVVGGFSQGGMMAYRWGLSNPELFRGLAALSSRLPVPGSLRAQLPASRTQSIFIAHVTEDTMISVEEARESRRFLEEEGYKPEYREYAMGHQITQEVLGDLVPWIRTVLPPIRLKGEEK